jgi:arabinogalactan oligomer/maltooligosaccharide transport system substrate-binding protein
MKKNLLTLVSILLVAAFALAACGAPATTAAPAPADTAAPAPMATDVPAATAAPAATVAPTAAPAPIEVTFWHAYGTGSAEEAAITKNLAQAAIDLPQYKINVLQIPFNDIYNKYRTDVAAGGGPDMFIAPNDSLGDDARAGLLADITDLAKGKLDGVSQLGIDGMSLDGKLYGIPETLKAVSFWYNTDLLKTAPKTTDELLKLMQGGTPISLNYGCYHMYGLYSAFGGNIFDPSWKVVADQGTGVVDAFTFLNTTYQIQKKNGWAMDDSKGLAPFSEGKLAAIMNGNWAMGDYRKALGDKLAVAPLPAGPGGPAKPMLGVDGFYINPNSANKEAAVAVALYLSNAKSQTVMMNEAGHVPVRTDVTITDKLIQGLVDAYNTGATIRPQVTQLGKYWSNFCGPDQIYEKGVKPADFVKTAVAAANK